VCRCMSHHTEASENSPSQYWPRLHNSTQSHCPSLSCSSQCSSSRAYQAVLPRISLGDPDQDGPGPCRPAAERSHSLPTSGSHCMQNPMEAPRPDRSSVPVTEETVAASRIPLHNMVALPSSSYGNSNWGWDIPSSFMPAYAGFNMTVKMKGATPADLPPKLRNELASILQVPPIRMMGSIRPGCVHLSVDVMFESQDDADDALAALHKYIRSPSDGESSWLTTDSFIRAPGCEYQMRNGDVENSWPATAAEDPEICSWGPVAPFDDITLCVKGVTQGDKATVWLRLHGQFHRVHVEDYNPLGDGTLKIHARVPMVEAGLGWLEVRSDERPERLGLSNAKPVLLTSNGRISEELTDKLPQRYKTTQQMANFLQAIADAVHPIIPSERKVELWAFMEAVRLGLPETIEELFAAAEEVDSPNFSKELLQQALDSKEGLISVAAMSGCHATLSVVLELLGLEHFPVDACTPCALTGMTPLHWAALAGNRDNVLLLFECCPQAPKCWTTLKGGPSKKTPSEMMLQVSPGEEITEGEARMMQTKTSTGLEVIGPLHDNCDDSDNAAILCRDVWGTSLMTWLTCHRTETLAVFLPAILLWRTWQQVALLILLASTIHFVVPLVHRRVYMQSLARVRTVAGALGVSISSSFCIGNKALQEAFHQSIMKSAMGGLSDLGRLALMVGWFSGTPVLHAYHHHRVFCPWSLLTPGLLLAALAPLRVWAGRCQDGEGCRRVNIITNMSVFVAGSLPALYCWPAGVYDYTMPTAFSIDTGPTSHMVITAGLTCAETLARVFFFAHRFSSKAELLVSSATLGLILPAYASIAASRFGVSYPHTLLGCGLGHLIGQLGWCSASIYADAHRLCRFFKMVHVKV